MDALSTFTSVYASLYKRSWMPIWLLTPARRLVRSMANRVLPKRLMKANICKGVIDTDIVASLTSFPARINDVWKVVACLLCQTVVPGKIILWLSKEQFENKKSLPDTLLRMENGVFEIRFVDGDIRSHKKYYYAMKEYPSKTLLLVDDDIFYPPTMVEKLMRAYRKDEGDIICRYGYRIKREADNTLLPYNEWPMQYNEAEGDSIFFGSGGGTVFKPQSFDPEVLNIENAIRLAPLADDVWLNAMARYSHLRIKMLKHGTFLPIAIKNDVPLYKYNQGKNENDMQIEEVIRYYNLK